MRSNPNRSGAWEAQADQNPPDRLPRDLYEFARTAAELSYPVLLYGETGCGKTHLARIIHQLGPRRERPFVHVNCASIPDGIFEKEMFGHVRGAFTDARQGSQGLIEAADGGTLFLDEIGEMPLQLQPKLLRTLEDGLVRRVGATAYTRVDIRLVAATNRDLLTMVREGEFREDLFYRCAVLECRVPPLRERKTELASFIAHFLREASDSAPEVGLSPAALEALRSYSWPGNIRELSNALQQTSAYAKGRVIELEHLPERIRAAISLQENQDKGGGGVARARYTAPDDPQEEARAIRRVLEEEGGNRARTARRLGMSRSTLWNRMHRYGLTE